MTQAESIQSFSQEKRLFPPPNRFSEKARVKSLTEYETLYRHSLEENTNFWRELGEQHLVWDHPFQTVLDWRPPHAKWFQEGMLNASVQCLDRHASTAQWKKTALIWEAEDGEVRTFTYQHLTALTAQVANALKSLGVACGDIVMIYMPMIPETCAAMLACARIGAAHSVVFGGFSSEALKDRIHDARAKFLITADGGFRRGQPTNLKTAVDTALEKSPSIEKVLVVQRTKEKVPMKSGRDIFWHDLVPMQSTTCAPTSVPAEHLLFTLYTSGTTGKPKGIMHTTAGYLLWCKLTSAWVFDLQDQDIYWCTADVGWVTGHSYLLYGPLQNGSTVVVYEGVPNFPDWGRFWKIIEKHKISIFYTAPTAIRALMGQGEEIPAAHNLSSLRLLGSVGEPINPEAWMWYHKNIGHEKCPIVDTWWQTETGGIMVAPLPGAIATKPGSCTKPLPGVELGVVRKDGTDCDINEGGYLVLKRPWPGMLRGIFGDPTRFEKTYFTDFKDIYLSGDGARLDDGGYLWVMGRVDDVINVSGHRLGTAEIESALVGHSRVVEAAVVGRPDALKGQAIVAFVVLKQLISENGETPSQLVKELREHVALEIGALARPEEIKLVAALPKTRSGKIMRRLLREIATTGTATGDTTTLEDVHVLDRLFQTAANDD